jgi:pimeloyl-ACP methyl ester carboxylesterase
MIQYPLAANGIQTRILDAGAGDETVVFIHGLGARADRWRRNIEAFAAAGYRCIAFDLPGHGLAQKGGAFPYGVPGYADYLEALLRELGIARAAFVGTSLGGHIAAYLTCRAPRLVLALVLVGATGLVPIGPAVGQAIRENVRDTGREKIAAKLRFVLADPQLVTQELVEEEFRINNSPGAAETFRRLGDYIAAGVDEDCVGDRLAALADRPPTLLVWGEEDQAVPFAIGIKVKSMLGLEMMLSIPGAAHAPYLERPELFNPQVISFLEANRHRIPAGNARARS